MSYIVLYKGMVNVETGDFIGDVSRTEEIEYTKHEHFDDILEARDFALSCVDAHIIKEVEIDITAKEK